MITLALTLIAVAVYLLVKIIKGALLLFDTFLAFTIGGTISHLYISHVIAEGLWAILFWDLLFAGLVALLYYNLLFFIRKKFLLIGKILNAICSFFNAFIVYTFLSKTVTKEPLLLFLKNTDANIIFNFLIIILISSFIYRQREEWFIEREIELDDADDEDDDDDEYDYVNDYEVYWKKQKNLEKELGYIINTHTEKMSSNPGLHSWATLNNIQTVSKLLIKLHEKGFESIQDLNADLNNKIEKQMSLISKTKEIEKEQEKLNETMELLHQYKIYKDYYEQSKTADKSYKSTYSAEIALYVAAVKQLKQMYKEEKIPSTAMILERLSCLDEMIAEINSEYKELSSSINELKLMQKNFNDYEKYEIENDDLEIKFSAKENNEIDR